MSAALGAGTRWFAAVFALGFLLGIIRTLWLAPALGATAAVLIELPVMLAAAWLMLGAVLRRHPVPAGRPRLAMGGWFLLLLIGAEAAIGLAQGRIDPLGEWRTLPGLLGLSAQLLTALMPLVRAR